LEKKVFGGIASIAHHLLEIIVQHVDKGSPSKTPPCDVSAIAVGPTGLSRSIHPYFQIRFLYSNPKKQKQKKKGPRPFIRNFVPHHQEDGIECG
jgi:hypothetical protein